LIYTSERLNSLGARHWRSFAGQNYFDPRGVFISALLSAPMLTIMFAVLINYLLASAGLLVQMKRKELVVKARLRQQEERQQAAQQAGGTGGGRHAAGGSAAAQRRTRAASRRAQ
jgi:hypothetical protein